MIITTGDNRVTIPAISVILERSGDIQTTKSNDDGIIIAHVEPNTLQTVIMIANRR